MARFESEGALKTFIRILPLLILTVGPCAVHGGDDSIVISSGNGSIVISGRKPAEAKNPVSVVPIQEEKPVEKTSSAAPRTQQHVIPPAVVEVPSRRYLAMFTASYCGPCQNWKATVYPQLRAAGYHVHFVEMTDPNNAATYGAQVGSFPTFVACDWDTGQWVSDKKIGAIDLNTAKWMLDSSVGLSGQKAVTKPSTVVKPANVSPPSRFIDWPGWGTIDLETYSRNCNCSMCVQIRQMQQEYRQQMEAFRNSQTSVSPDQEGTPHDLVEDLLDQMQLRDDDILGDFGCGDGRILLAAARRGIQGIGIEIDPERAAVARRNVEAAGLGHLVTIETGDALEFDAGRITVATTYLYPPLLAKLAPRLVGLRVVGSPYHEIPGLPCVQSGDIWIYRGESREKVVENIIGWDCWCAGDLVFRSREISGRRS